MLLESLPEPVVAISERECIVNADNYDRCRELIRTKLKPVNRLVFLYICMFLIELRRRNPNMRLELLGKLFELTIFKKTTRISLISATIFGRIMIRSQLPPARPTQAGGAGDVYAYTEGERDQRRRFMMTFLTSKVQEFARAEIGTGN